MSRETPRYRGGMVLGVWREVRVEQAALVTVTQPWETQKAARRTRFELRDSRYSVQRTPLAPDAPKKMGNPVEASNL